MHHGKQPVHPGTILLEQVMKPLGISRNQLARDIDVPVGRISDITNGKRGVTADTALRLAHYFGTDAELWMGLQADYDLHVARTTTWPAIEPRVRVMAGAELAGATPQNILTNSPKSAVAPLSAPVARFEPFEAGPVEVPSAAVNDPAGSGGTETNAENDRMEISDAGDVSESEPALPSYHGEPYQLIHPLDDDEVADDLNEGLVIPPPPKD